MSKKIWIWQQNSWPNFNYQLEQILPELEALLRAVAPLELLASELDQDKQLNLESLVLLDEAVASAKIEGEILDRESVRSSIAKHLGIIGNVKRISRSAEAFIDILLESVRGYDTPLSETLLFQWHNKFFVDKPILNTMLIGEYRNETMQIISGAFGKQKIHFEAPCADPMCVAQEMNHFLSWFNAPREENNISLYIKAAIAKFWFVTIHPFDDGNGRLSRIIAERCLASAEKSGIRLYSISNEIEKNRDDYYALLEKTQRSESLDLTEWIIWFLQQVTAAAKASMKRLDKIRLTTFFWDKNRDISFNARQTKLIIRLLETDDFKQGISRSKYKSLAHTTDITAARDLKDLVDKGILEPVAEGKARKYIIKTVII